MADRIMKTLTLQDGNKYIITDEQARNDIEQIKQVTGNIENINTQIEEIQENISSITKDIPQLINSEAIEIIDNKFKTIKTIQEQPLNETGNISFENFDVLIESKGGLYPDGGIVEFQNTGSYLTNSGSISSGEDWTISPKLPLDRIISIGNFHSHANVAGICYYLDDDEVYTNALKRIPSIDIVAEFGDYKTVDSAYLLENAPEGAKYVAISTYTRTDVNKDAKCFAQLTKSDKLIKNIIVKSKNKPSSFSNIITFSFDDTCRCLQNLSSGTYNSLFSEPFFAMLKEMHDTYGFCFALFVFQEYNSRNLSQVPDKFKEDFIENSSWLKFNLHAKNNSENLSQYTSEQAKTLYDSVIDEIIRFTGSIDSITSVTRLHNFAGSKEACVALHNCECGVKGFLCSDVANITPISSYYIKASDYGSNVGLNGKAYDAENNIYFFATQHRFDAYTKDTINTLFELYEGKNAYNRRTMMNFFEHEVTVSSNMSKLQDTREKLIALGEYATKRGFSFGFPENIINLNLK